MQIIATCPEYNVRANVDIEYIPIHTLDNPNNYLKSLFECSLISKGYPCSNSKQCPLYLCAPNETPSPYGTFDFCK